MQRFTAGELDILLSTSIIESGLDIPNANTLIVDRADLLGLAQLYQLRGRVGRGAQRAYAYFFRLKRKSITPEGRQRLETLSENTQLGAGYSIAMRDLEIRGAGEVLGTKQHGHITSVGFHLYTRLLANAVRSLRSENTLPKIPIFLETQSILNPVNVELPIPVNIPPSYVPEKSVRLGLYRRLADLSSIKEIDALFEEFNDRFGSPPETVINLLFQLKIKILASRAGLTSITSENQQIVLRFHDDHIPPNLPNLGNLVRIGKTALWMKFDSHSNWPDELNEVLKKLGSVSDKVKSKVIIEASESLPI